MLLFDAIQSFGFCEVIGVTDIGMYLSYYSCRLTTLNRLYDTYIGEASHKKN